MAGSVGEGREANVGRSFGRVVRKDGGWFALHIQQKPVRVPRVWSSVGCPDLVGQCGFGAFTASKEVHPRTVGHPVSESHGRP